MYRDYKLFDYENCSSAHENKFSKIESLNLNYDIFKNVCLDVVNKCAPLKKQYIRSNHVEYVDKELGYSQWENTSSNETKALTKSMNLHILEIGTLNQLLIRGSYNEIKFSKKSISQWQIYVLCDRFILYTLSSLS